MTALGDGFGWLGCSPLWIPAFAGMTGRKREKGSAGGSQGLVSGGGLGCKPLDSRFRGNDGGNKRERRGEKWAENRACGLRANAV